MASIARQVTKDLAAWPYGRRVLASETALLLPRAKLAPELVDARSLMAVGTAGLLALPALMLASIPLDAPLAGPAAISLGYLAIARAIVAHRPRRAAAWSAAVLAGFVAWTVLVLTDKGGGLSGAYLAAGLLAPGFAAAPALVRRFTRTGVPKAAAVMDVRPRSDQLSAAGRETLSRHAHNLQPSPQDQGVSFGVNIAAPASVSDVGEAIGFALRHVAPKAAARDVELVSQCAAAVLAACDQQTCRRILLMLIDSAIDQSRPGETVRITGKRLKGAVLMRVSSTPEIRAGASGADLPDLPSRAALRQTVENAGGTMVFEMSRGVARVSVRLAQSAELRR
ncbi:MAG: hypothetical protein M3453_02545 [Pseudomonadota bacterium]|nr:hypothetical protein [Pseudomonadota bacterium]